MNEHTNYTPFPASAAHLCQFWSAQVDHLECHLSGNTWVLVALTAVLIVYPIARGVIPALLHDVVPHLARTVFSLI